MKTQLTLYRNDFKEASKGFNYFEELISNFPQCLDEDIEDIASVTISFDLNDPVEIEKY